jgi:hypothetical protein
MRARRIGSTCRFSRECSLRCHRLPRNAARRRKALWIFAVLAFEMARVVTLAAARFYSAPHIFYLYLQGFFDAPACRIARESRYHTHGCHALPTG